MGCSEEQAKPSSVDDTAPHDADTSTEWVSDAGESPWSGDGCVGLTPNFWGHVAEIYAERCVGCHQEDGVAPFALNDYGSAKTWANAAAAAVQSRTMPPWLMNDDGSCNHFEYSRWLSDAEIDTIVAWAQGGAVEGTQTDSFTPVDPPRLESAIEYRTPEFVPEPQGSELAAYDEYRCFRIDPKLTRTQYLTGYNVVPGNAAIVHHVLLMPVDPDRVVTEDGITNGDLMAEYDAESPDRDGWPCFGAAGDEIAIEGFPVSWAPGAGVVNYPEDTGVTLAAGVQFVVQVHYNLADQEKLGTSDSTTVQLRLQDEVDSPGVFDLPDAFLSTLFGGEPDTLEPGLKDAVYTWELPVQDYLDYTGAQRLELRGLFPHMHELGRKMEIDVLRGGTEAECLGDVPRWDFNWQLFYFYDQPVRLESGDVLRVTCHFDTRGRDEPVLPGWGTQNEMCLAGLFLVPR